MEQGELLKNENPIHEILVIKKKISKWWSNINPGIVNQNKLEKVASMSENIIEPLPSTMIKRNTSVMIQKTTKKIE